MPLTPPERLDLPGFTLRAWTRADADGLRLALATSDAHLRAFTPWVVDGRVPGLSLEDRLTRHATDFAAGKEWVYGLFSFDGGEVLGGCGLYPRVGPNAVEVGYWLAVGHTGRGLATRATAALTRLAFLEPRIDHIEIHCDRRNGASSRVAERLGYRLEPNSAGATDEILVWRLSREEYVARVSDGPLE
jgi:RimJ/RimL family protein N-acetyltransferase